jgi:hypothetical protein
MEGRLWYANIELSSVSISAGARVYVEGPQGKRLRYNARYYSSTGGILRGYASPTLSAPGTEVKPRKYNPKYQCECKTKIYHSPTVTATGGLFRSIGISGGTAVGVNGSTGSGEQRNELTVLPGRYLLVLTPSADASTVIYDIDCVEEDDI